MKVTNLKPGSSGNDVKKQQNELIEAGYDVDGTGADGVFGKNTFPAVKQFQKDVGIAVNGIADKTTMGALSGGASSAKTNGNNGTGGSKEGTGIAATPITSPGGFTYGDFYYDPYDPMANEQISQAWNILQQTNANKPGAWVDPYQDKWSGYADQYENRGPFSYDFNSDALYNMYKDQYIQQGQMSMMDTMGQAAAMTGGYGNSYAQTVGQQAYNQQLSQLNNIMPELYGMAYDQYNQDGQKLLDMYNLYKGLSTEDYGRHQDSVDSWYRDVGLATDNYNNLYKQDWEKYLLGYNTALDEYNTDRSEEFSKWQTIQSQKFTEKENEKNRAAAAVKAEATSPYSTLDTEDTMTWIKKFENAPDITALDEYTTALAGIIGPEAAAIWFDTYSEKFIEEEEHQHQPIKLPKATYGIRDGIVASDRWFAE